MGLAAKTHLSTRVYLISVQFQKRFLRFKRLQQHFRDMRKQPTLHNFGQTTQLYLRNLKCLRAPSLHLQLLLQREVVWYQNYLNKLLQDVLEEMKTLNMYWQAIVWQRLYIKVIIKNRVMNPNLRTICYNQFQCAF